MTPLSVAAGLVVVLMLLIAVVGISVPKDARSYLDVAGDLRDGQGFSDPDHESAVHFPPGLSTAVAVVSLSGLPLETSALVVNALSWIGVVIGAGVLYRSAKGRSGINAWMLFVWIACGGVFTLVFSAVLSEGLFLAVSIWAVIAAERWMRDGSAAWAAGTWLLCVASLGVRYVGIALIAAVGLRILQQRWPFRRSLGALAVVGSSVVPIGLWYLRYRDLAGGNSAVGGIGSRSFGLNNVADSLGALASIFVGLPYSESSTVLHPSLDPLVKPGLAVVGLVGVALVAYLAFRSTQSSGGLVQAVEDWRTHGMLTAINYGVISSVMLLAIRLRFGHHVLARYWIAALLPLVVVMVARSPGLARPNEGPAHQRVLTGFIALLLVVNLGLSVALVVR